MANLKTAVLTPEHTIKVSDGWYVLRNENTVYAFLLNSIPLHEAELSAVKNPAYLLSGSLSTKIVESTLPPAEDSAYTTEKIIHHKVVTLSPHEDDMFYYRFLLGNDDKISFSSNFTIILDDWVEDISGRYVRVVYASLGNDVPLMLDNHDKICVSPI